MCVKMGVTAVFKDFGSLAERFEHLNSLSLVRLF
jgi:hypothetical protein